MNTSRAATTVALGGLAATAVAVVTACSPSSPGAPTSTPVPQRQHTSATAAAPSVGAAAPVSVRPTRPAPAATMHHAARPAGRSSSAPPAPTRSSPSTLAGPAACANGTVGVSAERGGALPGQELALLVFTNRSSSACSITGFPGVELLSRGHVVGRPATRSAMTAHVLTVAPGGHVAAMLHDDTRCNADLSNRVGVYVPNQTVQERIPLELRACALTIDPVRRR